MPAWIHNRAEHLLAKNPSMGKSTAFAIATQQSHATGKTPRGYGTRAGKREAKQKFDEPKKKYVKAANPGDLETPKLSDKPKTRWTGSKLVKKADVHVLSPQEAYEIRKAALREVAGMKLASAEFAEEMYKEALLQQLRRLLPGSKVVKVGDEVVDFTEKSPISYRGLGKHIEELGSMWRGAKGATPEQMAAVGADKGVAGRILGETLHGTGHHMKDASTVGIVANPLGKAVGGGIEGLARGSGKELVRATGKAGEVGAGGITGAVGHGLQRHAKRIGQLGEIGTGAATATALGHAVSPMAHGIGEAAKAVGAYKPLKYGLGTAGLNLVKDTAAAAAEEGLTGISALGSGLAKTSAVLERKKYDSFFEEVVKLAFMGGDDPYLNDQVAKPKTRPRKAAAPDPKYRVKQAMIPTAPNPMGSTGMDAQKKLKKSQKVGTPDAPGSNIKPLNQIKPPKMPKLAFQTSQYSGPLGGGAFPQASYIPAFVTPPASIKTAGPPSQKKGKEKKAAVPLTPKGRLSSARREGKPKFTGFSGPSVASVSKPIGFGQVAPGSGKNRI